MSSTSETSITDCDILLSQAKSYFASNELAKALESYQQILTHDSEHLDALIGVMLCAIKMGRLDMGDYFLQLILKSHRDTQHVELLITLGGASIMLGYYQDAIILLQRALTIAPNNITAHLHSGLAFFTLQQFDHALRHYEDAIALDQNQATAHYFRGVLLNHVGRHDEALNSYDAAILADPNYADAYHAKGFLKLKLGDYLEGWRLHEWRWRALDAKNMQRHFSQPLWLGRDSLRNKTIFIYTEQGLGDTLQFCRYIPLVKKLGAYIIFEVQKPLVALLSMMQDDSCRVIGYGEEHVATFDYHTPLLSLPLALNTAIETIPAQPYLTPRADDVSKWRNRLTEKLGEPNTAFRIGLCWAGKSRTESLEFVLLDARRSIQFDQYKPLFDIPGTRFVSLQLGPTAQQRNDNRVLDISDELKNFTDTAAVISLLDLVITVDTSVCHLSGALGQKTFLLNRYDTCWRWLWERDDSPWYPTLTQFRQPKLGDWEEVIERVRDSVKIAVENKMSSA